MDDEIAHFSSGGGRVSLYGSPLYPSDDNDNFYNYHHYNHNHDDYNYSSNGEKI